MAATASRSGTHRDPPVLTAATVLLAAVLAFLVAQAVPGKGRPAPAPDGPGPAMAAGASLPAASEDEDTGDADDPSATTWNKYCKTCHGTDGAPSRIGERMGAKDLRDAEVQARSDDELRAVIAGGAGKMPGYEDQIPPEQIDALVERIRALGQQ